MNTFWLDGAKSSNKKRHLTKKFCKRKIYCGQKNVILLLISGRITHCILLCKGKTISFYPRSEKDCMVSHPIPRLRELFCLGRKKSQLELAQFLMSDRIRFGQEEERGNRSNHCSSDRGTNKKDWEKIPMSRTPQTFPKEKWLLESKPTIEDICKEL